MDKHSEALEAIVDAIGLAKTLETLAAVCFEKADHLRANWQDEATGKCWDRAGTTVSNCAAHARIVAVS